MDLKIVRPRHKQVTDVADDVPGLEIDFGPNVSQSELGHYFPSGADIESALAFPLEEEGQEALVAMRAGAVVDFSIVVFLWEGEVVEEPHGRLRVGTGDVVKLDEVVVRESQSACEAQHQFLRHCLNAVHESQRLVSEPRDVLIPYPNTVHVFSELELVRLLGIRFSCGWADLRVLLPAYIHGTPRNSGLHVVWKGEKSL